MMLLKIWLIYTPISLFLFHGVQNILFIEYKENLITYNHEASPLGSLLFLLGSFILAPLAIILWLIIILAPPSSSTLKQIGRYKVLFYRTKKLTELREKFRPNFDINKFYLQFNRS